MSHVTHTTEAFILGGSAVGEANRYVSLFTKDLGFVRAVAKSARLERSKLRYGLQDYTFLTVSLVRGKEVWRVTGVQDAYSPVLATGDVVVRELFARISSLLRRLLQGEEPNEGLFSVVAGLAAFVAESRDNRAERIANVEVVTVLRILYHLGYLAPEMQLASLVDGVGLSDELLAAVAPLRRDAVARINESLSETQL